MKIKTYNGKTFSEWLLERDMALKEYDSWVRYERYETAINALDMMISGHFDQDRVDTSV